MKRNEVRQVDQVAIEEFGIPGVVLMENAGRGAAERIAERAEIAGASVVILCGTGNNGGDGYVIARHLEIAGFQVRLVSLVPIEKLGGDARVNADIAVRSGMSIEIVTTSEDCERGMRGADVIVDCLLGTGATGEPRGVYGDAVRIANRARARRVAIDIPTGLDCDSGQPSETTFRADLTVTFVATKDGFASEAAKPFLGEVVVEGIGVPKVILDRFGVPSAKG